MAVPASYRSRGSFQSNFVNYPGRMVEHCHIVSHEDPGMMPEIEIVPR